MTNTDADRLTAFWAYHAERTEHRAAQLEADGRARDAEVMRAHAASMRHNTHPGPVLRASDTMSDTP